MGQYGDNWWQGERRAYYIICIFAHCSIFSSCFWSDDSNEYRRTFQVQGVPKKTSLLNFLVNTNSGQIWAFWANLGNSGQFWAFWANLGKSGHSGQIWAFWAILGILGNSGHFGQFWAFWAILGILGNSGHFGQIWAFWANLGILGKSWQFGANLDRSCQFAAKTTLFGPNMH